VWYHIQLTWASGTGVVDTTDVVLRVNDSAEDTTRSSIVGLSGYWACDTENPLCLGNNIAGNDGFRGTIALFRLHNVIHTTEQQTDNFDNEVWRYGA
jgi:hypothetical protein